MRLTLTVLACQAVVLSAFAQEPSWISAIGEPAKGVASFRHAFVNRGKVVSARWKVSGLGVFEALVGGRSVGEDFLKPGFTECGKTRHVYDYDVTDLLDCAVGATNILEATVVPSWWCDEMLTPFPDAPVPWQTGREPAFWGRLELKYADGRSECVSTGAEWLGTHAGPVLEAGIYEGESYDARLKPTDFRPVRLNAEFTGELRPAAARVTLRRDLTLSPVAVSVVKGTEGVTSNAYGTAKVVRRYKAGEVFHLEPGEELVVDFGQNCAAVPSFAVRGEAGTRLDFRFAEMLNEGNGEKARGNDGPEGTPYVVNLRKARARLTYVQGESSNEYHPRYTFFGYRYAGITATRPVDVVSLVSLPVSSVSREMECGEIVTGNARVNRLVENARWSMRSNYVSVPTDCPQRDERLGWTADAQVFAESAMYLADVHELLRKYLGDLRDAQWPNGSYPPYVPNTRYNFKDAASAGWSDAGILIAHRLWKRYGDLAVVRENWTSMTRYMDLIFSKEDPWNHFFGDWLSFEHIDKPGDCTQDLEYRKCVAAFFPVWDCMLMREMAGALGKADEAVRFAEREKQSRASFRKRFLGPDGTLREHWRGQCCDLYMLKLGLCADAKAAELTRVRLLANIRANGNRLQTGFLGTAILLPTLTQEAKVPEVAYDLLLQDAFPSWLYSVEQGAATIWERWNSYTKRDGFGPVDMNSFNHYAYGCVVEWLFAYAAGIRADPDRSGFGIFLLEPHPDRRLGHLTARYRSPSGEIRSAWVYGDNGVWTWKYTVPAGTKARVRLPDGREFEREAGIYEERVSGIERATEWTSSFGGNLTCVIRRTGPGPITLTASTDGLKSASSVVE